MSSLFVKIHYQGSWIPVLEPVHLRLLHGDRFVVLLLYGCELSAQGHAVFSLLLVVFYEGVE